MKYTILRIVITTFITVLILNKHNNSQKYSNHYYLMIQSVRQNNIAKMNNNTENIHYCGHEYKNNMTNINNNIVNILYCGYQHKNNVTNMHNNTINIFLLLASIQQQNPNTKAECITTSIITTSFHNIPHLYPLTADFHTTLFFPIFFNLKFFFHPLTLLSMSLPSSKPLLQQILPSSTT